MGLLYFVLFKHPLACFMQRKFVNNLLFILFVNLLVKPFWILGIDVSVQNRLGAEEYGLYYQVFSFSILLNIILDFGITNYNSRNIAQHGHMLRRYFSGIFNVKLILGVVYMLVTLVGAFLIGFESKAVYLLFILGINQFLASMILYLRSNFSGLHLFKVDGIFSVMDRLLMIVICGYLLWGGHQFGGFKIEWFVYAQFTAYFFTALAAFFFVYLKAKSFKLRIDFPLFRLILKESLPFALLVLLMSFYYRLDSVMVGELHANGNTEVGIYAQAYRIMEAFNMFGFMFAGLLLPIFARMIKENQAVGKLVKTSFNLIFLPAVAIAIISWFYAFDVMDLLYIENVSASADVFAILMLSFVAIALTYVYGTLLTANGSLKALNYIALLGLLINFILNISLIPSYGAFGAAVATLVTQIVVILTQIIISKRIFKMRYSIAFILKTTVLVISGLMLAFFTNETISNLYVFAFMILAMFGLGALILGLVKVSDLQKLISKQ